MLRKLKYCIPLLIVALFIISGCAKSDSTKIDYSPNDEVPANDQNSEVINESKSGAESSVPIIDTGDVTDSGNKIIYTVNIDLKVDETADAMNDITKEAKALGGYVSDSSFTQGDEHATGSITLRIPPEKLEEFTMNIGNIGEVLDSSVRSQDVTDQYVDAQSRLTNAEAQQTQLLGIMEQAVSIEDILKVRTELNYVQEEIEVYKGQLRLMDNQVGYATVTVYLTQTYIPSSPTVDPDEGIVARWSFDYVWMSIKKGFTNSASFTFNAIGAVLIVVSYLFVPVLVIGAFVFGIVFIVKKASNRKAKKNRTQ